MRSLQGSSIPQGLYLLNGTGHPQADSELPTERRVVSLVFRVPDHGIGGRTRDGRGEEWSNDRSGMASLRRPEADAGLHPRLGERADVAAFRPHLPVWRPSCYPALRHAATLIASRSDGFYFNRLLPTCFASGR